MDFIEEQYKLPEFWAPVLINNDYSGLTDTEQDELDNFLATINFDDVWFTDDTEESFYEKFHDAPGVLACLCRTYTFALNNNDK